MLQYHKDVAHIVVTLGFSSFDTVIHNYRKSFLYVSSKHSNDLVKKTSMCESVCILWLLLCFIVPFFLILSVCLCVFVHGPCCLIQIKWWLLLLILTSSQRILTIGRIARVIFHWGKFDVAPCSQSGSSYQRILCLGLSVGLENKRFEPGPDARNLVSTSTFKMVAVRHLGYIHRQRIGASRQQYLLVFIAVQCCDAA